MSEPSAVAQMPPRVAQLELETQMLSEQIRALNADRDRPVGRIALLESSVDDMTGAIKRPAAGAGGKFERVRPPRSMTVKANFGPLLSNLHLLAATERRQGKTRHRLVVGPLPNSPAAIGLCAHFNAAHTPCRAVKFEGEQIAQR